MAHETASMRISQSKKTKSYHHGSLREALLREAERVLDTEGIQALSLRAVSRAVGVSHTAPVNHFGDLTGLLSELAADGLHRLADALSSAVAAAGPDPREQAHAMGRAYLRFAMEHPGLIALTSRSEKLDPERPALKEARAAAASIVETFVASRHGHDEADAFTLAAEKTALRSLVHGYAMLYLDGRLDQILAALPGEPGPEKLFDAVLDVLRLPQPQAQDGLKASRLKARSRRG